MRVKFSKLHNAHSLYVTKLVYKDRKQTTKIVKK